MTLRLDDVINCITRYTNDLEAYIMATTATALRMPEDLAARYDRLARSTGRTKTYYMNEALADSIDRFEYEYGILKDIEDYRAGRLKTYSLAEVGEMLGLDD